MPYPAGSDWAKNGITELTNLTLGDIPQAVLIRGHDLNNPILLYIHSHGIPTMLFAYLEYTFMDTNTEHYFTVVHYDQRACGKTMRLSPDKPELCTFAQYVADAEELIEILRKRFGKQKIFVIGESWGSFIGMTLAQKHPEWFYAFIGSGQGVNLMDTEKDIQSFIIEQAKKEGNADIVKEIESLKIPDPSMNGDQIMESRSRRMELFEKYSTKLYGPGLGSDYFFKALNESPEYGSDDFFSALMGYQTIVKYTIAELLTIDLRKSIPEVKVPVYFIMGSNDLMKKQAADYFGLLKAPKKGYFELTNAGHACRGDQPDAFYKILLEKILPENYVK